MDRFKAMQTFVAIILIAIAALLAALWSLRSQDQPGTAGGNEKGSSES